VKNKEARVSVVFLQSCLEIHWQISASPTRSRRARARSMTASNLSLQRSGHRETGNVRLAAGDRHDLVEHHALNMGMNGQSTMGGN
jgi:hypothetical protein